MKIWRGLENENLERYWKLKLQYSVVPIWHYQWPSWWWRWWGCAGPGGVLVLVDHLAPAQETLEGGRHNHPPTCLAVDCLFHILRIYFTHSHFLEYKCNISWYIRIGKCQYQKISHKLRWRCQRITVVKTLHWTETEVALFTKSHESRDKNHKYSAIRRLDLSGNNLIV